MTSTGSRILKKARSLSEEKFKELGATVDQSQSFPKSITKCFEPNELVDIMMSSAGISGVLVPKQECEFFFYVSKYCANIRNYFLVSLGMVGSTLLKYGTEDQKKLYIEKLKNGESIGSLAITEPSAGSNLKQLKASYEIRNGNYIINGKKRWITLGSEASFFILVANGSEGLSLFLVDADNIGIKRSKMQGLLSNRASGIAELEFKDVTLDSKALIGGSHSVSAQALEFALTNGRSIVAIAAVAMGFAAMEEAQRYAKEREQFGVKIWQHQMVQKMLGDAHISNHAGRCMAEEGFIRKRGGSPGTAQFCAMAKVFSSNNLQKTASDAIQIMGGNGMTSEYNVERYYREAKAFQFIEGTSEVLTQLIGRSAVLGSPKIWESNSDI